METQQSGHASRSGLEVKNGRISAKDGAPERLRCDPEGSELDSAECVRSAGYNSRSNHQSSRQV